MTPSCKGSMHASTAALLCTGLGADLHPAQGTQRGLCDIVHRCVAAEAVVELQVWRGGNTQTHLCTACGLAARTLSCAFPAAHAPPAVTPFFPNLFCTCTSQVASSSTGSGSPRTKASWCSAIWSCPGQAAGETGIGRGGQRLARRAGLPADKVRAAQQQMYPRPHLQSRRQTQRTRGRAPRHGSRGSCSEAKHGGHL